MPAWRNSTRRQRLPLDWPTVRARILKRDQYRCQWRTNGGLCGRHANQVDHIDAKAGDGDENLQALCHPHHKVKSSAEGGRARWAKRKKKKNDRVRPHPGLIDPAQERHE